MARSTGAATKLKPPKQGASFGADIRRVREARRISQEALGRATGYSKSYVSKVEAGTVVPSQKFVSACDKVFGTGDLFSRQFRRLVEGEHASWFAPYIDAEREAVSIRDFSTTLIMGLLQTDAYARTALRGGKPSVQESEIDALAVGRLRRREILERPNPPRVSVVMHEACLRALIGSARVMAEQLQYLMDEMRRHPSFSLQVLPYSAAEAGISTPYTILDLPDSRPVVYVEGPQGGRPYESGETLANSVRIYDHLRACALSPDDSVAYVSSVKEDHERNSVDEVQLQRPPGRPVRRVGPGARVRRRYPRAGQ